MKNKENWLFAIIFLVLVSSTARYIKAGEPYYFETDISDETIVLSDTHEILQNIIVDKNARWTGGTWSLQFAPVLATGGGYVQFSLIQNQTVLQSYQLDISELISDQYFNLKFDYQLLQPGEATIAIKGNGIRNAVGIYVTDNKYNLPDCTLNGLDSGKILVQKYYFHFNNAEYLIRVLLYALFVIAIFFILFILPVKPESKRLCNLTQFILIVCYFCIVYIYDSSYFFEPTFAEQITNFMHVALNKGFLDNLLHSDAGYLPLFQRLISIFVIKVLRIDAYHAVFIMQMAAYLVSGYILSFFVKFPFRSYMALKYRFVFCLVLMMQIYTNATAAYINFINYGIFTILLYFLADSYEWSKREYIGICVFCGIACMSKGQFVILLPYMLFCMLLFYTGYNKRDRRFMSICALGAGIQLIYYIFAPGKKVINLDSIADKGGEGSYVFKLIFSLFKDIPQAFLSVFEGKITFFNGVVLIYTAAFWGVIIYLFIKKVAACRIRGTAIEENYKNFFMMIIFLAGQFLFFRLTIRGAGGDSVLSSAYWRYDGAAISGRFEIFGYLPVIIILIICSHFVKTVWTRRSDWVVPVVFLLCVIIANNRLQISEEEPFRYYVSSFYSERILLRDIEQAVCRVVPMQPGGWKYKKNANIFLFGEDILGWKINDTEMIEMDVSDGGIRLSGLTYVNNESGIWQIFAAKTNLINNSRYMVVIKDKDGNVIRKQFQDNSYNQKIISYTFSEPVFHADEIRIYNEQGEEVVIENAIYAVTEAKDKLVTKSDSL